MPLFHALDDALFYWVAWNKHGLMPEAGGINDQSAAWRADMRMLNAYYSSVVDRLMLENPDRFKRKKSASGFTGFDSTDTARDWEGLFDG